MTRQGLPTFWRIAIRLLRRLHVASSVLLFSILLSACSDNANNPYPASERNQKIAYDFFSERPKHLDPVQSYVENESDILAQIYEPLYDYHLLKRPYQLIPNLATAMPGVTYLDKEGHALPATAPIEQIAKTVYEIKIRSGVRYQPHPAFALSDQGQPLYAALNPAEIQHYRRPGDFPQQGTRELVAEDFVYQFKRLVRPGLHSPVIEIFKVIDGLEALQKQLDADAKAGKIHPSGWIDLRQYQLPGVQAPDPHTLRITLRGKYPQFIYWLAQTFTVAMPWEADRFYAQPGMANQELTLDNWPVGTGPYMLTRYDGSRELRLERNPNWWGANGVQTYPCDGDQSDRDAGLLKDCGKPLPFIDAISIVQENEAIPLWNKFMQGYYDQFNAGRVKLENFDTAVKMPATGGLDATDDMKARGVRLQTEVEPAIRFYAFNMLDNVVGGDTAEQKERARKLRLAISIAIDVEEQLTVFNNGLGRPAQGPIPPGIFGYKEGCEGRNPYVYDCVNGKVQRKSIDEAKKLMREAGYPDGRDAKTGEPLIVNLDGVGSPTGRVDWLSRQFKKLGIQLVPRLTDFNRFQEKVRTGNWQFLLWGWNADFPDPENFMFLFHGQQAKVKYGGENHANYVNPAFDHLYEQLKLMDITADRSEVVSRMVEMLRHDAPWIYLWHDESFALRNEWLQNTKPGKILRSTRKYQRIDAALREQRRTEWNHPARWPLLILGLLLIGAVSTIVWQARRHAGQRALPGGPQ
ncbi:ABC transporter substrate-binding protein [Uliginosibacterium sp. H3]|uniref:ABC transporter substrate-binding protein n=1 Tax=Uliginosibacterium silvisoli TaxID=3114758 RepID=A0ABU6K6M3_9RHOO|nr:ABC transporter substrate-binding protein [Uliginosibacterium sp. H3]